MAVTLPSVGASGWGPTLNAALDEMLNGARTALEFPVNDKGGHVYNAKAYGIVGDGATVEHTAIMTLISLIATAGGGTAYFPKGTYILKTTGASGVALNLFQQNKVRLRGEPGTVFKLDATSATNPTMLRIWGNDTTVEDITFDTNGLTDAVGVLITTADNTLIRRCKVTGTGVATSFGFRISNSVTNLTIDHCATDGVNWAIFSDNSTGGQNWTFSYNHLDGNDLNGDGIEMNEPTSGGVTNIRSIGNLIHNFDTAGSSGIGIGYANVNRGLIEGNIVYDCELDGIHIEDNSQSINVNGNLVYGCSRSGITVQTGLNTRACTKIIIAQNTVIGCCLTAGHGIAVEGDAIQSQITIIGNISHGNGVSGGTCYAYEVWAEDSIITDNQGWDTIGATTAGMRIVDSNGLRVTGNRLGDTQGSPTQDHGLIVEDGCANSVFRDNDLRDNGTAAVSLAGTSTVNNVGFWQNNTGYAAPGDIYVGSGSPEGVIAAPVGAVYRRTDGSTSTTLYVKTSGSGSTGWTAK